MYDISILANLLVYRRLVQTDCVRGYTLIVSPSHSLITQLTCIAST